MTMDFEINISPRQIFLIWSVFQEFVFVVPRNGGISVETKWRIHNEIIDQQSRGDGPPVLKITPNQFLTMWVVFQEFACVRNPNAGGWTVEFKKGEMEAILRQQPNEAVKFILGEGVHDS